METGVWLCQQSSDLLQKQRCDRHCHPLPLIDRFGMYADEENANIEKFHNLFSLRKESYVK